MSKTYLESITADAEAMRLYQEERLIVAVTELICKEMNRKSIKRADLALMLDKSRGRISQYLDGERNMTLRTVADIFTALGLSLRVQAEPLSIQSDKGEYVAKCPEPQHWVSLKWKTPSSDEGEMESCETVAV
jgi:transcriptional regulator with XRE-family HTH domain